MTQHTFDPLEYLNQLGSLSNNLALVYKTQNKYETKQKAKNVTVQNNISILFSMRAFRLNVLQKLEEE